MKDSQGNPIDGASIQITFGKKITATATSAADGTFSLDVPSATASATSSELLITASREGFASESRTLAPSDLAPNPNPLQFTLRPATFAQQIVVTASRTPLALDSTATSIRIRSASELAETPALTLDDRLRLVPGFVLYRRTSSRVANPTTEGVSLRGLGSTAASRTLVLSDEVPLSDPFGGWIHWDEIPQLAIQSVELARGGQSDLYGSSAIGGVINVIPVTPSGLSYVADGGYAAQTTPFSDARISDSIGPWAGLAALSILRSDGYTLVAPDVRGLVDIPSSGRQESGRIDLHHALESSGDAFIRGNVFNEARSNGTPDTTNGTRLWRYAGGLRWTFPTAGTIQLRAFGSDENYRQTFSAVAAGRASETLTRIEQTPSQELGLAAQWYLSAGHKFTFVAGADTRDIRATDLETPIKSGQPNGLVDTSTRQRDTGVYGEVLWAPGPWSFAASGRVDRFDNLDTNILTTTPPAPVAASGIPNRYETVLDPRLGVVRRITPNLSLTASGFRAFRGASLNELYRTGQVGQETTLANSALRSERATGGEAGALISAPNRKSDLRASYFWTEVNRPITALLLSSTPTKIIDQRENLGQIRSRGLSFDFESSPLSWLSANAGYQYAKATVTANAPQPALVGNWIPQVARNMATAEVRLHRQRWGTLSLSGIESGHQFDDANNQFLLHSFFQLNVYAEHALGPRFDAYASVQNLLDRSIDAGRTPILTLGTPQTALVGIRLHSPR